jgi:hypothetical protein
MVSFVLLGIKKEAPHPVGWRAVSLAVKLYFLSKVISSLGFAHLMITGTKEIQTALRVCFQSWLVKSKGDLPIIPTAITAL